MAVGKEVGDLLSVFEKLLARIERGHVYTEEEHTAMSDIARVIELETSLYRLEHLRSASDATH